MARWASRGSFVAYVMKLSCLHFMMHGDEELFKNSLPGLNCPFYLRRNK
ncbi:hypothetical protein BOTU111922_10690 [Bordetella tumulicola]